MSTNIPFNGLIALAAQVQTLITYVAVGTGTGLLSTALTSGTYYTTLALQAGAPSSIPSGTSLTIVQSGSSQTVTTSALVNSGDMSISVNSFQATSNYGVGSGVVTTPANTDTTLQNEVYRVAAPAGVAGATPGETLNSAYMDPTTPAGTYIEAGFFGGPTATGSANTGALIARGTGWWVHVLNSDSASLQLDSTV